VANCETVFQDCGTRFCPEIDDPDILHVKSQRRNLENKIYSISNPASDSDLEEGVNEKQHDECEVEYYLHCRGSVAIVLTRDDTMAVI